MIVILTSRNSRVNSGSKKKEHDYPFGFGRIFASKSSLQPSIFPASQLPPLGAQLRQKQEALRSATVDKLSALESKLKRRKHVLSVAEAEDGEAKEYAMVVQWLGSWAEWFSMSFLYANKGATCMGFSEFWICYYPFHACLGSLSLCRVRGRRRRRRLLGTHLPWRMEAASWAWLRLRLRGLTGRTQLNGRDGFWWC